jgi:hypothetical protein
MGKKNSTTKQQSLFSEINQCFEGKIISGSVQSK